MKFRHEVSDQKLRGGYYTPPAMVSFCLSRVDALAQLLPRKWLEPSAGDGAFVRGLSERPGASSIKLTCVELDPVEAAKCRRELVEHKVSGTVIGDSVFPWLASEKTKADFDVVIGNPPYVRYQFLSDEDRTAAEKLASEHGLSIQGVSNAWILFALLTMLRLRVGGVFCMVLPAEMIATISAGQFRNALVTHFECAQIDMFQRGTFPGLLQDVVVVSGRRSKPVVGGRSVTFVEHGTQSIRWNWHVDPGPEPWTRYLLSQGERESLDRAQSLPQVCELGSLARLQVSVVTGANAYFTISDELVEQYDLEPWAVPLLARTSHSPGIRFTTRDFGTARKNGARSWLLDFSTDRPRPDGKGVLEYIALGESLGIPSRYKCRVRKPWYRVPHIVSGAVMLTKRAHQHHRLLLNAAGVVTTDTVYRGKPLNGYKSADLVAVFHNSLTILSSELEGRTYGGGVLELVPTEISRVRIPWVPGFGQHLAVLDKLSRASEGQKDTEDRLAMMTDAKIIDEIPEYAKVLPGLYDARRRLRNRRFVGATDTEIEFEAD